MPLIERLKKIDLFTGYSNDADDFRKAVAALEVASQTVHRLRTWDGSDVGAIGDALERALS